MKYEKRFIVGYTNITKVSDQQALKLKELLDEFKTFKDAADRIDEMIENFEKNKVESIWYGEEKFYKDIDGHNGKFFIKEIYKNMDSRLRK